MGSIHSLGLIIYEIDSMDITSGATLADLLAANVAAEPFLITCLYILGLQRIAASQRGTRHPMSNEPYRLGQEFLSLTFWDDSNL